MGVDPLESTIIEVDFMQGFLFLVKFVEILNQGFYALVERQVL